MNTLRQENQFRASRIIPRAAFSLIEVLVVVGLLSFIIFGLLLMFTQTQKAFKTGMTQTDVLEAGRVVTDMIGRELEQIAPSHLPSAVNFEVRGFLSPRFQVLTESPVQEDRTNIIQDVFFLSRENTTWQFTGYFVHDAGGGAGTLYRYHWETNNFAVGVDIQNAAAQFFQLVGSRDPDNPALTGYVLGDRRVQPLIEGVVSFNFRCYNPNGILISQGNFSSKSGTRIEADIDTVNAYNYQFTGDAVPAYVELELGVLEKRTYEEMKSIPNANAQANFLRQHAGQVHLFRQRVTVRNVDTSVYP